jgi:hypothetical protein
MKRSARPQANTLDSWLVKRPCLPVEGVAVKPTETDPAARLVEETVVATTTTTTTTTTTRKFQPAAPAAPVAPAVAPQPKPESDDKRPYTAIIYEGVLEGVPDEHPLRGISYVGQAVRPLSNYPTPDALLRKRSREHVYCSESDPKQLGIRAIIKRFGVTVMRWSVIESRTLPKVEASVWADEQEIHHIADRGGVIKDMEPAKWIKQTFNIVSGGNKNSKQCAQDYWDAIEAHKKVGQQRTLRALREFKAANGHMRVKLKYTCLSDGDPKFSLGTRVCAIRTGTTDTGSEEEPTPFRVELDALGFIWDADEHERQRVLTALGEFKVKNGHMRVEKRYTCLSDGDPKFALGRLVSNIRTGHNDTGTPANPTLFRVALDALGFIWDADEHDRQRVLTALCEFKAENGHMRVKRDYTCLSDGDPKFPLGLRMCTIRWGHTDTGTAAKPTPYRIALDALGFIWDTDEHERQRVLTALGEFKVKNGHMRVEKGYTCLSDGDSKFALGNRVNTIRTGHTDTGTPSNPTPYRIALDAIGFIWDADEHEKKRVLTALREFKAKNGHVRVRQNYTCLSDGDLKFSLGRRVSNIRSGRIDTGTAANPTPYRIALNAVGLWW